MLLTLLAQAPAGGAANPLASFVPIILIFIIMYFLLFRPQMRRQKEQARLVSTLKQAIGSSPHVGLISN
jgi:preprotein translocase subunit YajC